MGDQEGDKSLTCLCGRVGLGASRNIYLSEAHHFSR